MGCLREKSHGRLAAVFFALVFAVLLAVPSQAFALTCDKATAKPNEDGGSGVIGAMDTRLTWEGTVEEGESVTSVTLELPEGASFDASTSRITVLEGLTRVSIDGQAAPAGNSITLTFSEAIPAGSLLRLEITNMQFPADGGDYQDLETWKAAAQDNPAACTASRYFSMS